MSVALPKVDTSVFADYAKRLEKNAKTETPYAMFYETQSRLCSVLEKKLPLAKKTRALYEVNDREGLRMLAEQDYNECIERLDAFYNAFRKQWYAVNKTYGFEVQDARLGGLKRRLESCRERLLSYVNGEISEIAELAEPLLPLDDTFITSWGEMITSNIV